MKRFLTLLLFLCLGLTTRAQMQITTRREKLSDFPNKTTKVVLTGSPFMDRSVKAAMKNVWTISPFEFCTPEEFDALKGSPDYYFMSIVKVRQKGEAEAGTAMITVVKGGTGAGIGSMLELVRFPLCAADALCTADTLHRAGLRFERTDVYLPAILHVIQTYIAKTLDANPAKMQLNSLSKAADLPIFIAEEDLSSQTDSVFMQAYRSDKILVLGKGRADKAFVKGPDALFSYSFAPARPGKDSYCYKMLFNARTYDIYYFNKHRIKGGRGGGFLKADIYKIAHSR